MAFSIYSASDMPLCPRNYWWRSWLSRLQWLHGEQLEVIATRIPAQWHLQCWWNQLVLEDACHQNLCIWRRNCARLKNTSAPKAEWVCCYAQNDWHKLPPQLNGKAARPHALKRKGVALSKLKLDYYHNSNGWMTSIVFEHQLGQVEWDRAGNNTSFPS